MKFIIEVHHTITLDPPLMALLKAIFPNQVQLDAITKDIKDKTATLQTAVTENTTQ